MEGVAVALVVFRPYPSEGEPPRLPAADHCSREVPMRPVLGVAVELARRVFPGGIQVALCAVEGRRVELFVHGVADAPDGVGEIFRRHELACAEHVAPRPPST